jgi:hypothetical protein
MNSVGRVWFGVARANVAAAWRIRAVFVVIRGQAVSSLFTADWRGWDADENSVRIGHVGVARSNVAAAWRIRGVFVVIRGQAVFPFLPRIGADGTRMRTA